MSETPQIFHVIKSPLQSFCSYKPAESEVFPLGPFELLVVEATQAQIEYLQKLEIEGRITFEDIKAQYTKEE